MSKIHVISGLLAAVFAGSVAAAPSAYYVVVPVKGRAAAPSITLALAGSALPQGLVGRAYERFDFSPLLTVTGDSTYTGYGVRWRLVSGALPDGLSLSEDGKLSGTPLTPGTKTVTASATYRGVTGQQAYQLVVAEPVADFQLDNAASKYTFDAAKLGFESSPQTITVRNAGQVGGSFELSAVGGAAPSDFSATSNCHNVAPAASCVISVSFRPSQPGVRTASMTVGARTVTLEGTGTLAATQYRLLTLGSGFQIPYGVNTVKAVVVGGGGGGGGAGPQSTYYSGEGGGAGGAVEATFQVSPRGTLSYSIGMGGKGGTGVAGFEQGQRGGDTTLTYQSVTLSATGGYGGKNSTQSDSGTWGTPGALGGAGIGGTVYTGGRGLSSGNQRGGGAGGGVGGVAGERQTSASNNGGNGGKSTFRSAELEAAGAVMGAPGLGAIYTNDSAGVKNGGHGTGFGHGGGGAAVRTGGDGGNGAQGGGGGGATPSISLNSEHRGGDGGAGYIVLKLN